MVFVFLILLFVFASAQNVVSGRYEIATNFLTSGLKDEDCSAAFSCVQTFPPMELYNCDKLVQLGIKKQMCGGDGSWIGFNGTTYEDQGFTLPYVTIVFHYGGLKCDVPHIGNWDCFGGLDGSLVSLVSSLNFTGQECTAAGYAALDKICMQLAQ